MANPTGYLLHTGRTGGRSFVAIATMETSNRKTGDMVQIWFLLRDINPVAGVAEAIDAETVCRGCPFASGRGCYVNVGQAPLSIWRAFHRGAYPELRPADYGTVFGGRKIRFGAYGNPSLLPIAMVKAIAAVSAGWTGYFHDWRENPMAAEYAKYFMASTETQSALALAQSLGMRTFHVSPQRPAGSIECLADAKGLQCAQCKLCSGLSKARQPSIWIAPHGSKRNTAAAVSNNSLPVYL